MAQQSGSDAEREKSKHIGALTALWPFMRPYTPLMIAAILALSLTAAVSLILPMAVRRVVDNFNHHDGALLDLMRRSGCIGIFFGIESFGSESLRDAHKPQNKVETYKARGAETGAV